MSRHPIPTYFFALVVVRDGDRFLVVHERKHGQTWYLPAGRVEPGESLADAARRETLEESGVPIVLEGVLRIEHTALPDATRVRVVFLARPQTPGADPRRTPNEHSLEARFVSLAELGSLHLRGEEMVSMFRAVLEGRAPLLPMSALRQEGDPW